MNELTSLLQVASEGEREAVLKFLRAFQSAMVTVPEKEQDPAFQSFPPYPNRPLNILALRDGSNIIVPVFSEGLLVEAWSARPLKVRSISTTDLIKLLPEEWWIALNPGSEIRKDFSPWELQKLLGGEEELFEIATDLELEHGVEPLVIRRLKADEFTEVRLLLSRLLAEIREIREFYLAIEEGKTIENSPVETLLIGVRVSDLKPLEAEKIRTTVRDSVNPLLIGSLQLRLLLGVGFSDLELGVFADIPPEMASK